MSVQMQTAIILFIFAFIIGFFLMHMIRKGAYAKRYTKQLATLEEENAQSLHLLSQTKEKKEHMQSVYDQTHTHFSEKKEQIDTLHKQESNLMQTVTALEEEKAQLLEKIKTEEQQITQVKAHIDRLDDELKQIHTIKERLSQTDTTIKTLEKTLEEEKTQIASHLNEIENLKAMRKKFKEESKALEEEIFDTKASLHAIDQQIKKIKAKYKKPLQKAQKDTDTSKIMALNYEYAVKTYEKVPANQSTIIHDRLVQKLFRMPDSKSKEIDALIQKTDGNRLIDTIKQKFIKTASRGEDR